MASLTQWTWVGGHEQAPGVGDGQRSLVCFSPWGHKESDRLCNWTELKEIFILFGWKSPLLNSTDLYILSLSFFPLTVSPYLITAIVKHWKSPARNPHSLMEGVEGCGDESGQGSGPGLPDLSLSGSLWDPETSLYPFGFLSPCLRNEVLMNIFTVPWHPWLSLLLATWSVQYLAHSKACFFVFFSYSYIQLNQLLVEVDICILRTL